MQEQDCSARDDQFLRMIVEIGAKLLPEGGIGERQKIDCGKNTERAAGNGWAWNRMVGLSIWR
ncbi:Uncharacterised protein [Brucella melitensis]|nr:Uncharacterised protein [Brucella melitensis]